MTCDLCGNEMVLRTGKKGQFWGCSGYPTCRGIKNFVQPQAKKPAQASVQGNIPLPTTDIEYLKLGVECLKNKIDLGVLLETAKILKTGKVNSPDMIEEDLDLEGI